VDDCGGLEAIVRTARKEDCHAIAFHAYLAGKSHLVLSASDFLIPGEHGPTTERLSVLEALLQTDTVSWFHYTHYLVAEVNGNVEGSMCIFSNRNRSLESMDKALSELGWTRQDIQEKEKRMTLFEIVDFDIPYDQLHIETTAVSPAFREQGVATLMLEKAVKQGRSLGFREAYLTVLIGNTPALRTYEKVGFEVVAEKLDTVFEKATGCQGKALMSLRL
jgi:ribosomal protein S18 acetylase RimI-like enzyme